MALSFHPSLFSFESFSLFRIRTKIAKNRNKTEKKIRKKFPRAAKLAQSCHPDEVVPT
jgi:hypothetical protein